ncbi:MAG TPA: sarcosine oxidase subunit delta [Steroidobacteraceae bacterium]|jgi:sarcosine oxidase subunit delta|nr:sarcosine oxidase subunit delta [Steroidobacteraceae bacterium]
MRIECPFCGERDVSEFSYLGDAAFQRPPPDTEDVADRFYEAVYLRENPAGPHQELWYHASGCLSWLRVTRNTRTHEILAVQPAGKAPHS